jgi:hypothetical protein
MRPPVVGAGHKPGGHIVSKHRPGPWKIDTTLCDPDSDTVYDVNEEPVIPDVVGVYENHPPDIDPFDLQLIAAAPELLEACEIATEYLEQLRIVAKELGKDLGLEDVISQCRNTITKATGKTTS